jgi:hypothetical protein
MLIQNLDMAIREQYNQFTMALDELSKILDDPKVADKAELHVYIRNNIEDFENELSLTVNKVRDSKNLILTAK